MTGTDILTEPFRARTLRHTVYCLAALPLGTLWFCLVVTGVATGASLAITLAGIPLLWLTFVVCGVAGDLERAWARVALGVVIEPPSRRQPRTGAWYGPLLARIADPQSWRDAIALLLSFGTGIAAFTAAVTVWAVAGFLLATPIWALGWKNADFLWDGNRVDTWYEWLGALGVGGIALVAAPWVVRGFAELHCLVFRTLLGPTRRSLQAETSRLAESRTRSVDAAAAERRRIERDLHDGAQARLVSLAMDLGRAKERVADGADPSEIASLVEDAHDEAKRALVELRDLARGIHPAVLTDRGLDAALSALAANLAVPVTVTVELPTRPPASVEAVAYFVVNESLANVAKHAGATRASVSAELVGNAVVVKVTDDGRGGAEVASNGGLAGLADRVASIDGTLSVRSASGAGTTITAVLPCG